MKKRILALFLAVCTVILSVPLLALPALADGTDEDAAIRAGLVTSYLPDVVTTWTPAGDNWPAYQNGHVAYKDNWTLVQKTAAGVSNLLTGWDAGASMILYANDAWSNGGMYQASSSWKYGMVAGSGNTSYATAISYTSPYTGKVKIDLRAAEQFSDDMNDARCRVAIFVDGQMVWPNTGDYYTDASKWYATTGKDDKIGTQEGTASLQTLAETGISVEVGQRIELAVARLAKEDGTGNWGGRALGNVTLELTFTELTAYQNVAHMEGTYSYMYHATNGTVGTSPQHFKEWLADQGLTLVTTATDTLAVGDITYTDTDGNTAAKTEDERNTLREQWYDYYAAFGRIGYEGAFVPGMLWDGAKGITGNLTFAPINQVGYMTGKTFPSEWNGTNTSWDSWGMNAARYLMEESWAFKNTGSIAVDGWGTNAVGIWGVQTSVAQRTFKTANGVTARTNTVGCFTLAGSYNSTTGAYISIAAQQYTAPADGLASFTLLDGTALATSTDGRDAPKFCLMIGDTVVYPATADIHDPDTWADGTDVAALNAELAKVKAWMQKGDTATFCYAAKAGGNVGDKNTEGRFADPQVTLQIDASHTELDATVGSLAPVSVGYTSQFSQNNSITLDQDVIDAKRTQDTAGGATSDDKIAYGAVRYPTNWEMGAIDTSRNFYPLRQYNYEYSILCNSFWHGWWNKGGAYKGGDLLVAKGDYDGIYRYTVPASGTVTVEVKDIYFKKTNHQFTIQQNGVQVWPATGTFQPAATATNYGTNAVTEGDGVMRVSLTVTQGDTIDFRVHNVVETEGDDSQRSTYGVNLSVSYTAVASDATTRLNLAKASFVEDYGQAKFTDATGKYIATSTLRSVDTASATTAEVLADLLDANPGTVLQNGKWKQGALDKTGTFSPITRVLWFTGQVAGANGADVQWLVTEQQYAAARAVYLNTVGVTSKDGVTTPQPWGTNGGVGYESAWSNTNAQFRSGAQPSDIYAQVYEAEASGYLDLSYDYVSYGKEDNTNKVLFCIAINGTPVWPSGAKLDDASTWWKDTTVLPEGQYSYDATALNAALANVHPYVEEGDQVQFLMRRTGWVESTHGSYAVADPAVTIYATSADEAIVPVYLQDADGEPIGRLEVKKFSALTQAQLPAPYDTATVQVYRVNGEEATSTLPQRVGESMTVQIIALSEADKFASNKPDNSTKPATFRGNWSVVNGHWTADISKSYASWSYDKTKDLFVNWDESGTVAGRLIATNGLWTANGGGFYVDKGYTVARQPSSLTGNAVLYTAPYDGVVDLDFTSLMFRREVQATAMTEALPLSAYLSITLNGEVIWPSTGRAWQYVGNKSYDKAVTGANSSDTGEKDALAAAKAYEAFPTVQVKAGDEIAFVVNMGNASTHMCEVMPQVTYLQTGLVCADTTVNVSATLDSDIRLTGSMQNGTVTMARYDNSVTEAGASLTTALSDEVAFMANEMTQKGHYLATVQSGTQNVVVRAGTVSVADYCNKLITMTTDDTLKALAVATLHYGAEAQKYFDGVTDEKLLANYGLTGNTGYLSTDLSTLTATRNVGSLTDATGATITGATLVLKDKVHIKLYVTLKEGTTAEGLTVKYGVGSNTDTCELELCDDGSGYKAYIAVPASAFGSDYMIQIVKADGTQVSNQVIYSVQAYAKQMNNSENGNLLRAIVALGNAAEAYVTPQA